MYTHVCVFVRGLLKSLNKVPLIRKMYRKRRSVEGSIEIRGLGKASVIIHGLCGFTTFGVSTLDFVFVLIIKSLILALDVSFGVTARG